MQSKLNQKQIEILSKRYELHPLLHACRQAFECYEAEMKRLLFAPEEIFFEAAIIIDNLLAEENNSKEWVNGLWNKLKIKIRRWEPEAPQEDLNKISGAILYVVAATLCQHSHHLFNYELKDLILDLARNHMDADFVEEERIIKELADCADALFDWFSEYQDSTILLSEEIIVSIQEPNKKNLHSSPKNQVKNSIKHRETMTFNKNNSVLECHLSVLFSGLIKEEWIDGNVSNFMALFSGVRDKHCQLTWKRYGKGTLVALFKRLIDEGIVILPHGYTLSAILEGHFMDKIGKPLTGLDKGNGANKKALPLIDEFVKLMKTDIYDLYRNKCQDDDFLSEIDKYDHQDLHYRGL